MDRLSTIWSDTKGEINGGLFGLGRGMSGREVGEVWTALEAALHRGAGAERRCSRSPPQLAARSRLLALRAAAAPDNRLSGDQLTEIRSLLEACKETLQQISTEHRSMHLFVSRIGKSIDRHFISDMTPAVPQNEAFSTPEKRPLLDEAVILHLYREGQVDIAETLAKESGVSIPAKGQQIAEFQIVAKALEERDPQPALEWLQKYANPSNHTELIFKLHRLIFKKLTKSHGHISAIYYAQKHFPQFADEHEKELQKTMCLLIYDHLPKSHSSLNDDIIWNDSMQLFLKEASKIMNFPAMSCIRNAVDIGSHSLPMLFNIHEKMLNTHREHIFTNTDELPFEIANTAHSLFSCPILRQQSSEQNPPMRLVCGHVVSKEALEKLSRNSRLKCPYCPTEQLRTDAKILYF